MSKAIVNALTLALLTGGPATDELGRVSPAEAKAFAEAFVTENAELFEYRSPIGSPVQQAAGAPGAIRPSQIGRTAVVGLMPHQQAALEAGRALCPNCQQPTNDHLPGCARVDGGLGAMDPKAVTKNILPPAEA